MVFANAGGVWLPATGVIGVGKDFCRSQRDLMAIGSKAPLRQSARECLATLNAQVPPPRDDIASTTVMPWLSKKALAALYHCQCRPLALRQHKAHAKYQRRMSCPHSALMSLQMAKYGPAGNGNVLSRPCTSARQCQSPPPTTGDSRIISGKLPRPISAQRRWQF